ncbi:MAG: hypothetical protein AB1384_12345 [Actinomycetota bacterium]
MLELLGFEVEETGKPEAPYILHGKRGARYELVRNTRDPKYLLLQDPAARGRAVSVAGYSMFADHEGYLRPASKWQP